MRPTRCGAWGPAYLAFAREEPGYYAAMFSFHPLGAEDAPGEAEPGGAFAALTGTIGALLPGGGRNPRLVALQVWALSHGVAMLERVGMPAPENGAPPAEAVLEKGVTALLGRM